MKILIATGVYPPDIGGPSQYAKALYDEFGKLGHHVSVARYSVEKKLPNGIRHLVFSAKILLAVYRSRMVLALDTFSVGVPSVFVARLFRRKVIVRISGDFLWEQYVERTGNLIPLKKFYETLPELSCKERIVFNITRWMLHSADYLAFTTVWQKDIWMRAYGFPNSRAVIVENFFRKLSGAPHQIKNFVWAVRPLKLKNGAKLKTAFSAAQKLHPEIVLDDGTYPYDELQKVIQSCYAVILPSISDVSPNLVLDGLAYGKPFIMTQESGYADLLGDVGLLVNPLDQKDITAKIETLADDNKYGMYKQKAEQFAKDHSYKDIAVEYLRLLERV